MESVREHGPRLWQVGGVGTYRPCRELPVFMEMASLKMKTGSGLKKSLIWLLKSLLSGVAV